MANQKLKTMYDEYKLQLDKNKLSAQNELNKANQKANNYMQNYLKSMGIQDSGLGQSAYTNLGTNYANQMVGINQDYSSKLTDFRKTYNQQAKNEAQTLMQGMDNTQLNNYANSLAGDTGLDNSTTNYIRNLANLYRTQNDKTAQATKESEQSAYDETAIKRLESYLGGNITKTDQDKYVDKLMADEKISQSTKDYINEYIDSYGKGWKTERDNYANEIADLMNNAESEEEYKDYSDFYNQLSKAQSEEDYDNIVNDFVTKQEIISGYDDELKLNGYAKEIQADYAKVEYFGKFKDSGTNRGKQDAYVQSIIDAGKKEGTIPEGTYVNFNYGGGKAQIYQYKNGKWVKTTKTDSHSTVYDEKNIDKLLKGKAYNTEIDKELNEKKYLETIDNNSAKPEYFGNPSTVRKSYDEASNTDKHYHEMFTNATIEAAKKGEIPNGTLVNFGAKTDTYNQFTGNKLPNYSTTGVYKYENGSWKRVQVDDIKGKNIIHYSQYYKK